VVVTSPRVIAEIEQIIRIMDVPGQQVMLEARLVEVSTDAAKRLGIDWDMLNRQGIVIHEGPPSGTAVRGGLPDSVLYIGGGSFSDVFKTQGSWFRENFAWATAIDLMIRDGNARVLANPKITTINGREASILVGSRIPFLVSNTVFAGGAAAPVLTVQREEVGVKLAITPTINSDGYITTEIRPEVSSIIGFTGPDNSLPIVSTRQASTTVRIKNGNSVIIGGLLSEERTKNVTKVPLLGDIPGLGVLFQHHNSTITKKDLVIEVTPHIIQEAR
jgi:type II secretory pathway component GspD/PulD (secretin)